MSEKKYKLVHVQWVDITQQPDGYWTEKDNFNPADVDSLGYLVQQNNKFITIAQSVVDDGSWGGVTSIPVGCIYKISRLKCY